VDRLACVDVPELPLQLLRRRLQSAGQTSSGAVPLAVVVEDRPLGMVSWVNEIARQKGVLPGQRYAAAQSLAPDLRAGCVSSQEIADSVAQLAERLRRFSPEVEPAPGEAGVFWLDARGLDRLHPSATAWAQAIAADLAGADYRVQVVVGFRRFATYAIARATSGVLVLGRRADEERAMRRVPLDRIGLLPETRDQLAQLAVRTVGEFLALPHEGIRRRFGEEAHLLHQRATGQRWDPLQPEAAPEPLARRLHLDDPDASVESLLFRIKQELDPLLGRLAEQGQALSELAFHLQIDHGPTLEQKVRPAEPSLDVVQLLTLVRLRLESLQLQAGVVRLDVGVSGVRATREQLQLFVARPRRDLRAGAQALARLKAAFGDEAVVRARLCDGHLPEARSRWEPISQLTLARPIQVSTRPLVRRVLPRPLPLPPRLSHEPDGWLIIPTEGPVKRTQGPYRISGGWWKREVERDYFFAELASGTLHWVYFDRHRRRWFYHGKIG
jgi:protein ImuB